MKTNSPASTWRLIIDKFVPEDIQSCTITEAHRQARCKDFTLTVEELEAFISIMYVREVTGKNDMPLAELWNKDWGIAFCKQMISKNCFKKILRFLQFDKKSSQSERLQTDKFVKMDLICKKRQCFLS